MKKRNERKKWMFMVFMAIVLCYGQAFGQDCGDVNTDAKVDIVDALLIAQYCVGLNPVNFNVTVVDVNADDSIDIVDALLISQYSVGLISELSCSITDTDPIWSGGPYTFNGTNGYAEAPDGLMNNLSDFSIAGWVNLNAIPNWVRIFDFGISTNIYMMLTPKSATTGYPYFCITINGNSGEQGINGTSALTTGSWQHFAIVKSGTTGIMYINKIEVGRNTDMTLNPSDLGNTTNNYIGRSQWTNDPYLDGNVDKFYIYNKALSAAEITALGNNPPANITPSPTAKPTPTPEEGETAMQNPLIWADAPDPDVICVGNDFYMSSTSMHMMPGVPIMHSTDLVNWEIVSYVYQTLENNNAHNLLNGQNIYGKGSWATSLRYHNNTYYMCFNSNDMGRTYVYKTNDIRGTWSRYVLGGSFHDPSLLFDDDGRVYIIYGAGDIRIVELTADATAIKSGGVNQRLFSTPTGNIVNCEGSHAYKINGMYYIFLIQWPNGGRRIELCYRSSNLLSGYQSKVILNDDLGYNNKGIAQGGVVSLPGGQWYGMLFQDHDSVGRIPVLVPVTWTDNWPIMGVNGKAPTNMTIPLPPSGKKTALLTSDEFGQTQLGLNWQWNHNPNNNAWSLSQRPGYLRLVTANTVSNILQARNTLSQRTIGPTCSGAIAIQTENMNSGDYTGIAAFQNTYGFIGVKKNSNGQRYIIMATNGGSGNPSEAGSVALNQDRVYLKINFNFTNSTDKANFYYSLDGNSWIALGSQLQMKYTLDHFMGYRIALFNYATSTTGGYVDVDYFHAASPAN